MEYAKKMVLVDPRMLESAPVQRDTTTYTQPESVVIDMTIRGLHEGLQKILNNPNMSEDDKAKLYGHYLQEYLTMRSKQTKVYREAALPPARELPLPTPQPTAQPTAQPTPPPGEGVASPHIEREIVETAPKLYKKQAHLLVERIKQDPSMSWNSRGELVVEGAPVPNSNVVDLVNDMLRRRKSVNPVGWQTFARQLRKSNVPQDLVRNVDRWAFMQQESAPTSQQPTPFSPLPPAFIDSTLQAMEEAKSAHRKPRGRKRQRTPAPGIRSRTTHHSGTSTRTRRNIVSPMSGEVWEVY